LKRGKEKKKKERLKGTLVKKMKKKGVGGN